MRQRRTRIPKGQSLTAKPGQPLRRRQGRRFSVGAYTYPTSITMSGRTAIVAEPYHYTVDLAVTWRNNAYPPVTVGAYLDAITVAG